MSAETQEQQAGESNAGNRWASFSDAELQELEQGLGQGETARPGVVTKLTAELVVEMQRRNVHPLPIR